MKNGSINTSREYVSKEVHELVEQADRLYSLRLITLIEILG